jgi:hypothetical protein
VSGPAPLEVWHGAVWFGFSIGVVVGCTGGIMIGAAGGGKVVWVAF